MSKMLVDTSAWIEYFRVGQGDLSDLLDMGLRQGLVVTCGVVLAELLRGVRGRREENILADALRAVPYVELDRSDWENTGRLLSSPKIRALRIPLSDGLIAQLCIRHALSLLTLDKHFEMFEHVMRAGLR